MTRETQTLRNWSGAGPTTELSCQNVADPEPGGPYPSRTKREPTSPTRCGPRPELDPRLSYHARLWLSRAGLAESESDEAGAHTLWTWDGAEPNAGPAREPKPRVHQRDTGAGC